MPTQTQTFDPNHAAVQLANETFGAQPGPDGPIGGGGSYIRSITTGTYRVHDLHTLLQALDQAQPGEIVFIEPAARIDLTERVYTHNLVLRVPAGVTLASDRGHANSPGGLLFSDAFQTSPLIEATGPDVRIVGLRLRGPDPKRRLQFHYDVFTREGGGGHAVYYKLPNSDGIQTSHPRLCVENCEISAFSHGGVHLREGAGHALRYNFVHHCQRMGLGYGICHDKAQSLIAWNLFQDNKHDLAGTGAPGSGYEAHDNIVLPPTESHAHPVTGQPYGQDHLFDMHGGRDRRDNTDIAGQYVHVHHNTFVSPYMCVAIRGVPEHEASVHHNWFMAIAPNQPAVRAPGGTRVWRNAYSSSAVMIEGDEPILQR